MTHFFDAHRRQAFTVVFAMRLAVCGALNAMTAMRSGIGLVDDSVDYFATAGQRGSGAAGQSAAGRGLLTINGLEGRIRAAAAVAAGIFGRAGARIDLDRS